MIWGWLTLLQPETGLDAHDFALLFEHHAIPCTPCFPCADPGFFVRGWGGGVRVNLTKKSPDNVFLVLSLFYWSQMVNFEENSFFKVPEGVQHFPGGSNFFQGGSNCLYPIETHITCDFPGGSGPPDPPLDPHSLSWSAGDSFFPLVVFFSFI